MHPRVLLLATHLSLRWGGAHGVACGTLVPWPGIEPGPWQWQRQVLTTTGLPGSSRVHISKVLPNKSLLLFLFFCNHQYTFISTHRLPCLCSSLKKKPKHNNRTFFPFYSCFFPIPLENVWLFTCPTNISWAAPDIVAFSLEILLLSHLTKLITQCSISLPSCRLQSVGMVFASVLSKRGGSVEKLESLVILL